MPGTSDLDQLTKIFDLCGSPTDENFPGWNTYDPKVPFQPHWGYSPRRIKDILPPEYGHIFYRLSYHLTTRCRASADTIAFLDRLLTLDPVQRITAFEALDHDYFWTEPLPADPKSYVVQPVEKYVVVNTATFADLPSMNLLMNLIVVVMHNQMPLSMVLYLLPLASSGNSHNPSFQMVQVPKPWVAIKQVAVGKQAV